MEKNKDTEKPLMVTIRCTAYNHEPYIRDCLEGFVKQRTNFRFEAIVHDDASKDGTASIIREYAEKYPDIIKPIFESENQYSKHDGSLNRIMNAHTCGRYVAYCEGDDYWTDPLKLQKQFDILEKNPNITMVYTNFETVDKNGVKVDRPRYEHIRKISKSGSIFYELLTSGNFVMTVSTMYRRDIIMNQLVEKSPFRLDYLLTTVAAGLGDVFYIKDKTCCYRWTPTGMMETNMQGVEKAINGIKYYIEKSYLKGKLNKISKTLESHIIDYCLRTAFNLFRKNENKADLIHLLKENPRLIFRLIVVITKYGFLKVIKKRRNEF